MNKISQRIGVLALFFALTLIITKSVRADVIASNLNQAQNSSANIQSSQWEAVKFATGNQTFQLTSIKILLSAFSPTQNQPYTGTAVLVQDNNGLPGSTVLASFAIGNSISSTASYPIFNLFTFSPNLNVTLAANTSYWIVLESSGPGYYLWGGNNTTVSPYLNTAQSYNSGTSWTAPSFTTNQGAFLMEVDGSSPISASNDGPIPLWALGALGAGLVGIASRRLKKSTQADS